MKRSLTSFFFFLFYLFISSVAAQQRRPIDNEHPMWLIHVDVWNTADPQKIIDLIPAEIKPYVCMNLSFSCQYDKDKGVYKMPRCAVRTYKSWGTVCQKNGLWFTCQPASGGHTHIQDDDLVTFEYFFKKFPNFLGWNYAEQFWGFDEAGDKSSSTQASRIALFAKLVEMSHQYGGFLTVSFCGNIWSHPLNPMGMMKRNSALLKACKDYPEAILWLYKYTTSSCFYNNESVTFGPFVSGLAKNYGVRYDNCGWNGALEALLGKDNGKKYPGAAGIGTVMEQTCVNGGAVWDGPELIWTEDFQNLSNTTANGYTRRRWGTFPNFKGIWLDMFGKIIDGTMYIPSREEVVGKTKIAVQNNVSSGNDEQKYAAWGGLYDGLYKQTDPFNRGSGQWMDNFCYFKSTGRYGAIPIVIGFYDDAAKAIPVQVKKSNYSSQWGTQAKKVTAFNEQYPEVSKGDLYVNRYRNQLVTYTPYTYLNKKKTASADIPLQYNTCDTLKLTYGKLSSGLIREYADHIDFYLNNYRSDSTTAQTDKIVLIGVSKEPTYTLSKHTTGASGYTASATAAYDADAKTYTVNVKHMGPLDLRIDCSGTAVRTATDALPAPTPLPTPKQPEPYVGPIVIEAEDMDYKSVAGVNLSNSGWYFPEVHEYAGNGFVNMGTNTSASLRHELTLAQDGEYDIIVRYCKSSKKGNLTINVNNVKQTVSCEKKALNDWHKVKVTVTMKAGKNTLIITNTGGLGAYIDQIIYAPAGTPAEQFLITIRDCEHGKLTTNVDEAAEGDTVRVSVTADEGYRLKELRVVNSVYYTMAKTINVTDPENISFVMTDENVTLQPVFADNSAVYTLAFDNALAGTIPAGWKCVQEKNDVHEYPNSYSSGARIFNGFTGYDGKALYWRNTCAEYGRQSKFLLTLEPAEYKLTYAMAAWKASPKYKVQILSVSDGSAVAASQVFTATPNANGNTSANLSSATKRELPFTITKKSNYVISFTDETGVGDLHEFLLLLCRINKTGDVADGIRLVNDDNPSETVTIYDLSGTRRQEMGRGLNIIRTSDGRTRKVLRSR